MRGICCARLKIMNTIPARVSALRRRDAMNCWLLVAGLASDTCVSDSSLLAARFVVPGSVWSTNLVKPHVSHCIQPCENHDQRLQGRYGVNPLYHAKKSPLVFCKVIFYPCNYESRSEVILDDVV
jgi:hypothetical protein